MPSSPAGTSAASSSSAAGTTARRRVAPRPGTSESPRRRVRQRARALPRGRPGGRQRPAAQGRGLQHRIPTALVQGDLSHRPARPASGGVGPRSCARPGSTSTSRPSPTRFRPRSARANGPDRPVGPAVLSDPTKVGRMVGAFIAGMHRGGWPRRSSTSRASAGSPATPIVTAERHHRPHDDGLGPVPASPSAPASRPVRTSSWSGRRSTAGSTRASTPRSRRPIITDLLRGPTGLRRGRHHRRRRRRQGGRQRHRSASVRRSSSTPAVTSCSPPDRTRCRRCTGPDPPNERRPPPSPPR